MQEISVQPISIADDEEDDSPGQGYRAAHVEPFHRQRRVDGSSPFSEQIGTMQRIVVTNGIDGRSLDEDNVTNAELTGGIWKEVIHTGIGQKPTAGACV